MKKEIKNKINLLFSSKDIKQIKRLGLNLKTVRRQLDLYKRDSTFLNLNRPCKVNDGIISVTPVERKKLISFYEKNAGKYKLIKFVPASGAASRMFAEWFSALDQCGDDSHEFSQSFLNHFKKYPFYSLTRQDNKASQLIEQKNIKGLLEYILLAKGLNLSSLPKALIPFHKYRNGHVRTAIEEHIFDAAYYACGAGDVCNLHFTIPQEHQKEIIKKIEAVKSECQTIYGIKYYISYSFQSSSTDMLTVDKNNLPLRDDAGDIVFRPGGHGALLRNLNKLNADFIFIRNVDNVAPQHLWGKIMPYKKMMGGLIMKIQEDIFSNIGRLKAPDISYSNIEKIQRFCSENLNIDFPRNFKSQTTKDKIKFLFDVLNRPLRVCGVVRNNGEPGGGPFWVEENDGTLTLQIVEGAHVDKRKNDQAIKWSKAKYFNPVDMVCSIKDCQGKKFNLFNYVNDDSFTISSKKEKGRNIKALEVPGLWNGSMAYWNTVFVKLPLIVFNPVKTVKDLLRPEHLMS